LILAVISLVVLTGVLIVWRYQNTAGGISLKEIKSIAVLPLKSFSADAQNAPLQMRITDALITRLGGFNKIAVRPTNSVARFAGEERDAVEARRLLGVDAVFDGRVQTENDRLRVTLQLISTENGEQIWSEQFDGRTNEILALQDVITKRLRQKFDFAAEENRRPTENNEAYEAYLKGRYLWNQRTADSYWKALEYFHQSIAADPNFALGYTGISDCYHLLQKRNLLSADDAFLNAEKAARKALELDPASAEANTSMAAVSFIYHSRWAEAERFYLRAIELNPNYAEAHARYGMLLNVWGRFDEAFAELKKAESLDPTSLNIAIYLGANFYFFRQYERAAAQFQRIVDFAPNTERAHFFLTRIYEINGKYNEAVESAVSRPQTVEPLRQAYQTAGIRGFWQKQIELLKEESKTMHGLESQIASRYVMLGETGRAIEYLKKDLKIRGRIWNYGRADPSFDTICNDARFQEILREMDSVNDSASKKL
jgi:serine/threonine-protein kinase